MNANFETHPFPGFYRVLPNLDKLIHFLNAIPLTKGPTKPFTLGYRIKEQTPYSFTSTTIKEPTTFFDIPWVTRDQVPSNFVTIPSQIFFKLLFKAIPKEAYFVDTATTKIERDYLFPNLIAFDPSCLHDHYTDNSFLFHTAEFAPSGFLRSFHKSFPLDLSEINPILNQSNSHSCLLFESLNTNIPAFSLISDQSSLSMVPEDLLPFLHLHRLKTATSTLHIPYADIEHSLFPEGIDPTNFSEDFTLEHAHFNTSDNLLYFKNITVNNSKAKKSLPSLFKNLPLTRYCYRRQVNNKIILPLHCFKPVKCSHTLNICRASSYNISCKHLASMGIKDSDYVISVSQDTLRNIGHCLKPNSIALTHTNSKEIPTLLISDSVFKDYLLLEEFKLKFKFNPPSSFKKLLIILPSSSSKNPVIKKGLYCPIKPKSLIRSMKKQEELLKSQLGIYIPTCYDLLTDHQLDAYQIYISDLVSGKTINDPSLLKVPSLLKPISNTIYSWLKDFYINDCPLPNDYLNRNTPNFTVPNNFTLDFVAKSPHMEKLITSILENTPSHFNRTSNMYEITSCFLYIISHPTIGDVIISKLASESSYHDVIANLRLT